VLESKRGAGVHNKPRGEREVESSEETSGLVLGGGRVQGAKGSNKKGE